MSAANAGGKRGRVPADGNDGGKRGARRMEMPMKNRWKRRLRTSAKQHGKCRPKRIPAEARGRRAVDERECAKKRRAGGNSTPGCTGGGICRGREKRNSLSESASCRNRSREGKDLEARIPKLRQTRKSYSENFSDMEKQKAAVTAEKETITQSIRKTSENLAFAWRKEAAARIKQMREQKAAAEEALRVSEENWRGYQKVCEENRAVIEAVKRQLSEKNDEKSLIEELRCRWRN